MIGTEPAPRDLDIDLRQLVLPQNLLCGESLSQEALEEEEPQSPYRVVTCCTSCSATLRFFVVSTNTGIRDFQELLFGKLSFVCVPCSRRIIVRDGRQ